jgi:hypothetical protein
VRHELDGAEDGRRGSFIVECKATSGGITKADAALFHFKVMDFYKKNIATGSREKWWPVMCGAAQLMNARMAALSLGLFVCDAGRLPLPVLLRAAGKPAADMHLPAPLLQEIVRLGARALRPQQARWHVSRGIRRDKLQARSLEGQGDQGPPLAGGRTQRSLARSV